MKTRYLPASSRRNLVTIESNASTEASSGAVSQPFGTTVCKLWGKMTLVRGGDLYAGNIMSPVTTYVLETSYYPGLTETMRVVWGSRVFDILSIDDPNNEHRSLIFELREGMRHGS